MESDKKNWNISPFVQKLWQMINDSENQDVIRFDVASRKIYIGDKKQMEYILPKYFRHHRFESFVRQLNWYGFHKVNSKSLHCYEHPDIENGHSFLNIKSRRLPIKKTLPRLPRLLHARDQLEELPERATSMTQNPIGSSQPQNQMAFYGMSSAPQIYQDPLYQMMPFYFQYPMMGMQAFPDGGNLLGSTQ